MEVNLPDGDATRGWRKHWRRGMYGAIVSWAAGSQGAVIFMLAECVLHFNVVEAVGKRLGLVLSEEAVAQAEIDTYIIERVKAALHVLKHCQSEAARIEYGIVLAALAPERLGVRDPKGIPVGGAPLGVVARVRRAAAAAGDAARRRLPGVAQAVHQQLAPPPRELSVLSAADENVILANCW